MRIDESLLRKWTDEITFKRARQYYEEGYVEALDMVWEKTRENKTNKLMKIKTRVIDFDGFSSYDVEMKFNSVDNKVIVKCSSDECVGGGPCKHVTAALLKYVKEYQDTSNIVSKMQPIDELLGQLKAYSEVEADYKRELNLEIKFIEGLHSEKPSIELKIGVDKIYVVKSAKNFFSAVLNEEKLEFGKSFIYDPYVHKFNEVDESIIEMLLEMREIEGERTNRSYDYYYNPVNNNSLFSGKKILFTDKLLQRFFKLAKGRKIDAVINEKEYKDVNIIEGSIPLKFKLGMTKETIDLSQLDEIPKPLGGSRRIFWYKDAIYMVPKEQSDLYEPLYNMVTKSSNKKISFNKNDGEKIASYLVPMLKKLSQEVVFDKNIEESFYEEPISIKTYLDKQADVITATVKYNYGDTEIDPFSQNKNTSNKGILIRDISKEENCEAVLKSFGFERDKNNFVMNNEKNIVGFVSDGVNKLQQLSDIYYSDSFKNIKVYGKSSLKGGIRLNEENLLEFSFELQGVDRAELKNVLNALREKKKYYRLKDGGFVLLEDKAVQDLGEMIDFLDIKDKDLANDVILLSKYNALYLDQKIKDKDMDYGATRCNMKSIA